MRFWPWSRRARNSELRNRTYQHVWGTGGDITRYRYRGDAIDTALSLVPVYAATRLLADSVASLPLQTFQEREHYRERVTDPPLVRNPSETGTVYDWVHRAMTSLTLRGNAFGLVTARTHDGYPARVEWLHPDDVALEDDRTEVPRRWYWQGRPVDSADFVHIPGYTLPGRVLGLSPISAYRMTIETGLYATKFGRDWFANGSVPAAVLEAPAQVEQVEAQVLKQRFKAAAEGREPVVLANGLTYKPISVPADESQFLATLKLNASQVASIYGIPPEMIGGESGNSLTYANTEQQAINFVTYTLRPWLVRLETAISNMLPRGKVVRFNVDAIVRADLKTRYEAHHLALTDGWLSLNEVREIEGRPPLPNGMGEFVPPQSEPAAPPVPSEDEQ